MKKKILSIVLCFAMVFTMTGYAGFGDYTYVYAEDIVQDTLEQDNTEQDVVEVEKTIYQQLILSESVAQMYSVTLEIMNEDPEGLKALTKEEIESLRVHIKVLDPERDDVDTEPMLSTLAVLPNSEEIIGNDIETFLETSTINGPQDWEAGGTLTKDTEWTFNNGAVVTFKQPLTIASGVTLTLKGWGGIARFSGKVDGVDRTNVKQLFYLQEGAALVIQGTSTEKPFTIDGKSVIARTPLIESKGSLNFNNAVVQNGKYRERVDEKGVVHYDGKTDGGGIYIYDTGSLFMNNSKILNNTSGRFGGGLRSAGPVTIINSEISNNKAMTTETYNPNDVANGPHVNLGRGGGFHLTGQKAIGIMENVTVANNIAMYYGGGGQVDNYAKLTLTSGTFTNNEAVLHGAGALHLTSNATFIMNGGYLSNNIAHTVGGAIHTSYSCVMELNGGVINDNIVYGRGGGVHIDCGGDLKLNNTKIHDNKALDSIILDDKYDPSIGDYISDLVYTGFYAAEVDATGDNWYNIKYSSENPGKGDAGYGGGILIDSGTCTMSGGKVYDNHADNGGGGICFVMILIGTADRFGHTKVAAFDMQGGEIYENTTNGNGAGVYLMKNALTEEKVAAENNWRFVKDKNGKITNIIGQWPNGTDKYYVLDKNGNRVYEKTVGSTKVPYTSIDGGTKIDDRTEFLLDGEGNLVDINDSFEAIPYVNISGGTIYDNVAQNFGGGIYQEENTQFFISGTGTISNNSAIDGAGVYIASGTAEINGGTISSNDALRSGGAIFVKGTVTMTDGLIDQNTAVTTGGAVHIEGGDLTMTSGAITNNRATGDGSYGGGVYVNNGNVVVGVKDCDGTGDNHTVTITNKKHPIVQDNEAKDSGGGIALIGEGNITMYCGKVITNNATNPGRGLNVYMEKGDFNLYKADIGATTDPELVIVGGELKNHNKQPENPDNRVELYYYHCNIKNHIHDTVDLAVKVAYATKDSYFNLPDGEKYWDAEEGYRFFGWTFYGPDTDATKLEVRDKKDYKPLGDPINVLGSIDGSEDDNKIYMYALWAPNVSNITYKGVVIDGIYEEESLSITGNQTTYQFNVGSSFITLNAPEKDGYTFTGWYLYQDEGQNANWGDGYEPVYKEGQDRTYANLDFGAMSDQFLAANADGTYQLEAGFTNFGDITLVAAFEPAFTDLKIIKTGWDPKDENQSFVFEITGTPYNKELPNIDMTVTIVGNGELVIKDLPVGDYEVKEVTEWSWRYQVDGSNPKEVTLDDPDETKEVTFKNKRQNNFWLSSDSFCENWWGGTDNTIVKNPVFIKEGGTVNV